jgi:hypothetical protein
MVIEVELPDGNIAEFPDGTDPATIEGALAQQFAPQQDQAPDLAKQTIGRAGQFGTGFSTGLANVLGLPVDLINAALTQVGAGSEAPVGGSESLRGLFQPDIDISEAVGLPDLRAPQDATGRVLERVGEEIGAATVPAAGAVRGAQALQRSASPILQAVGQSAAAPGRFLAAEGATSVATGTGAGIGREVGGEEGEIVGQLAPLVAQLGISGGIRALIRGGEQGRQSVQEAIDIFADAGTTPTVGQATGRGAVQAVESVAGQAPGGSVVLRKFAQESADKVGQRVKSLTDSLSSTASAESAGRAIQKGITGTGGFADRFKARASTLFDKVDEFVPLEKPVSVGSTQAALSKLTGDIEGAEAISGVLSNPKVREIAGAFAQDVGEAGQLPYGAVKQLRTKVGNMLAGGDIITDAPRAELKQLYGALSDDLKAAADTAGPEASKAFSRANEFYKAGLNRVDNFLTRLSNKAKPEDAFRNVTSGTREGATALRETLRSLKPTERNVVVASVIKRMGRARPGAQDELGEVFSTETFLTNWNSLSKEAKSALMGASKQTRGMAKNLDSVAATAARIRESGGVLSNPSGTAPLAANLAAAFTATGGALAGDVVVPLVTGGVVASAAATSKLMTSPNFVRWLAKSTEIPAAKLPQYLARLTTTLQNDDPEVQEAAQEMLSNIGGQ